ncbi:tetratricopeptide repeat protein [Actinophytocola glycyrrhizae]|uniref:Tetratricopeptide repeat protein n=1 Tax=Actinophytocola glycyrrhizae TaxID=2044873 RepID=A0ABV9S6M5_9PSEU
MSSLRRRTHDICISYAPDEAGDVREALADALRAHGISVWPDGIWARAASSVGAMLALVSDEALGSTRFRDEIDEALRVLPAADVVPVATGPLDVERLPRWLATRQWPHLRGADQADDVAERLRPLLTARLGIAEREPVIGGDPPARVPLAGAGDYLGELRARRTGLTWIVGEPGVGKTMLAREYVSRVRDEMELGTWIHGGASAEPTGGRWLVVVDGLDEMPDERLLGGSRRVVVTSRRLPDPVLLHEYDCSMMVVGPLPADALASYLDTVALPPAERQAVESAARSGEVVSRLVARLVGDEDRLRAFTSELADPSATGSILDRALLAVSRQLSESERHRLRVLAFCADLLPHLHDELSSRLVAWGVCVDRENGTEFADRAVVESLRGGASRQVIEDAVAYVTARLPEPEDGEGFLPGVVELLEYAESAELAIWLAAVWLSRGEPARAAPYCAQAEELADQGEQRIRVMNLRSAIVSAQGRVEEALSVERGTALFAAEALGAEHPLAIASTANVATSLRALGQVAEAVTAMRDVVARSEATLPPRHPDLVAAYGNLAVCLRDVGHLDEALTVLRTAIERSEDEHARRWLEQILAASLSDAGRHDEAETVLRQDDQPTARANLAVVLARQGRLDEAISLQATVVADRTVAGGPDSPATVAANDVYTTLRDAASRQHAVSVRIESAVDVGIERDGDTVTLSVDPDKGERLTASLTTEPAARAHVGRFAGGRLRLKGVAENLRYVLRLLSPDDEGSTRTVGDWAGGLVVVRGTTEVAEPLVVISDPDGRTVTVTRTAAAVSGLGIGDRLLVVELPIRTAAGHRLLAPLRWNHLTDRCEATVRLVDADRVDGDECLDLRRAGDLNAAAVDESVGRALGETVDAWVRLAGDPELPPGTATVLRRHTEEEPR